MHRDRAIEAGGVVTAKASPEFCRSAVAALRKITMAAADLPPSAFLQSFEIWIRCWGVCEGCFKSIDGLCFTRQFHSLSLEHSAGGDRQSCAALILPDTEGFSSPRRS